MLKKIAVLGVLALGLTACQGSGYSNHAVNTGLIGAGAGALVGGLATGKVGGALAGAAIGGVGGLLVGQATDHHHRRWCTGQDRYGNSVRVSCSGYRRSY